MRGQGVSTGSQSSRSSGSDDLRLLSLVRTGDRKAFEELYKIYHPRLTRFLFNLVRRPTMVEDVLNETMMVVWERADTFTGASRLSTWIFAIAFRKAMKALRRQDEAIEDPHQDQRASLEASPEEEFGQNRRHTLLMRAIDELSPAHRAVVDLTYFHEIGYREIAAILDCPVDTVKTRMFHARRHLRRILEGELPDWV